MVLRAVTDGRHRAGVGIAPCAHGSRRLGRLEHDLRSVVAAADGTGSHARHRAQDRFVASTNYSKSTLMLSRRWMRLMASPNKGATVTVLTFGENVAG